MKHSSARLVLFIVLPLLVFIGAFTFALTRPDLADDSGKPDASQQDQSAVQQQLISTPYGERFAKLDALTVLEGAQTMPEAHAALQTFLDQYGLRLQTTTVQPSSYVKKYDTFTPLAEGDLPAFKGYATIFMQEWSKYPKSLIGASHTKNVVIIKDLKVSDTARAATPDPVGDAIYYDVGYGNGSYAREVIHHEYNHLIEYEKFGNYSRTDKPWTNLNPANFAYNPNGGAAAYKESNFTNDSHPMAGFVNRYAMYGMEEDKAEVFAYLLTDPYYGQLQEWVKTDDKLAEKVKLYKDFIKSLSPEMSGDYFERIHK